MLTGLQLDHIVREVQELEGTRAGLISDDTLFISGNAAFTGASAVKECKRFGRKVGYQLKSFFANDIVTSSWDGQAEFDSLLYLRRVVSLRDWCTNGGRIPCLANGVRANLRYVAGKTRCSATTLL